MAPRRRFLAAFRRLRAARVDVPVIVITGWDGDGDHEAAAEALGEAAFLRWPVDIDEVVAELEAVRRLRATPEPGPDDLHGARDAALSRTECVTDAALLGRWLAGERRTKVLATACGLEAPSADVQRAVKRVRDRIVQRLRRLGGALGRRARRPLPVHPLASRKEDHG